MADGEKGSSAVSIFAMVLLTVVVLVVLYFIFRGGLFGGKHEVDININKPGGSIERVNDAPLVMI